MFKDSKSKTVAHAYYRSHFLSEAVLGIIGVVGGILFFVFRDIWDDTLVMILVLWGFVMVLVLAWVVMRAVQKAQEKKRGSRTDPAADAWRMPPSDRK